MSTSDTDNFIKIYNELYYKLLDLYNKSTNYHGNFQEDFGVCVNKLKNQNPIVDKNFDFLDWVRRIRNVKIHDNFVNENLLVNDQMIQKCIYITNKLANPPKLQEYIDKRHRKIYQIDITNQNKYIYQIINDMIAWWYTYVPILQNGKMIWLFDNNVLASYLSQNKTYNPNSKLSDIDISLMISGDRHIYKTVSSDADLIESLSLFDIYYAKNQKLLAVVVIDNLGISEIITAYDINWIEENLL